MERYKKICGFSDMTGELYEVGLSTLLFVRSVFQTECFKLAVNVEEAGKFDDIFLWFKDKSTKEEKTCLLQLKHKTKTKVTHQALCSLKGDFSLIHYFCSYHEIKKKYPHDKSNFIIYTNTQEDSSLTFSEKLNDLISTGSKVLTFTSTNEEYKAFEQLEAYMKTVQEISQENLTKNEIKSKLMPFEDLVPCKNLLKYLNEQIKFNEMAKEQSVKWDRNSWDEFIKNVKLYINQVNEDEIDNLVKHDLEKYCGTSKFFDELKKGITDWWRRKEGFYITEKYSPFWHVILQKHKSELMNDISCKMAPVTGLQFQDMYYVQNKARITHIVCQDCVEFSCLRIQQSLINIEHFFVLVNVLRERLKEVLFMWKHNEVLVVVGCSNDVDEESFSQINNFLDCDVTREIIFISDSSDQMPVRLSKLYSFESHNEDFNLGQLTPESQNIVLNYNVIFQGKPLNLKTLVTHPKILQADLIMKILRKENQIKIGNKLPCDMEFYIPRTLIRRECVQKGMFDLSDADDAECIAFSGVTLSEVKSLLRPGTSVLEFNEYETNYTNCKHFIISGSSSFTMLSQFYDRIHWVEKCEESFIWKGSKGDINFLRNNIDNCSCPTSYSSVQEALNVSQRLITVIAEPGMGKTTEMIHLANVLKDEQCSMWVVCIFLNDHTDVLENVTAVELLCRAGNLTTDYEKRLFEQELYFRGNVVVIIDGFDEVSPNFSDKVISLIKELLLTKVNKICLTSRPVMREKLELAFSCVSFSFNPFSHENQIEFLGKFWNLQCRKSTDFTSFSNKLLSLTANNLNDKSGDFTGIPLQSRLLAEVFEAEAMKYSHSGKIFLSEYLDILQLYNKFVDRKYQLYFEKSKIDKTLLYRLDNETELKEIFLKNHMICALIALLGEHEFENLSGSASLKKKYKKFLDKMKEGKEKTGIILEIVNYKPVFLHRTLAEYFVALWLSKNYDSNRNLIVAKIFLQEWQTVKQFLDRILCEDCELHTAVLNKNLPAMQSLLSKQDFSVNGRDVGGRTALHLAVMSNNKKDFGIQRNILDFLLNHGADHSIEDSVFHWRPLEYALRMESWIAVEILLEKKVDKSDQVIIKNSIQNKEHLDDFLRLLAKFGFTHLVKSVLENGIDVNYLLPTGTMLHIAAEEGHLHLVKFLIEHGANLECRNTQMDRTAFLCAVVKGQLDVVLLLSKLGAKTDVQDKMGNTALILAAEVDNIDLMSHLISSGVNLNEKNIRDETAVLRAGICKNWDNVHLLCLKGANIALSDHLGNTLLHYTVMTERPFLLWLLNFGADVNCTNRDLKTPALIAADYNNWFDLAHLFDFGADPKACDCNGNTLLHFAAKHNQLGFVNYLLSEKVDVDLRNKNMETPVLISALHNNWQMVFTLLQYNADVNVFDNNGNTLLHYAVMHSAKNFIEFLLCQKIEVNAKNRKLQSPVLLAAAQKKWDIVKLFLEKDINIWECDSDGNTLIYYAEKSGPKDIISYLKKMETDAKFKMTGSKVLFKESNYGSIDCDSVDNKLLHKNAKYDARDIIMHLLDLGISINAMNKYQQNPALMAAVHKRWENVKLLLEKGANYKVCDSDGNTLLHLAAKFDARDIVINLLDLGIDVNAKNMKEQTAVLTAAVHKNWEVVKLLLEHGCNVTVSDVHCNTLLHYAIEKNASDIVIHLLNMGVKVYARNKNFRTPALLAASRDKWEIVKILLDFRSDPRSWDIDRNTLLHYAAERNSEDIVIQLLKLGEDVNIQNNHLQTPAHLAADKGNLNILKLLTEHGADVTACDNNGNTLLHYAKGKKATEIITYLLDLELDINLRNKDLKTPILTAAYNNSWEGVKLLLCHGAKATVCDIYGDTLLHFAIKHNAKDIIDKLLGLEIDINASNKELFTPVLKAAECNEWRVVRLLLKYEADPKAIDCNGDTLLHYAVRSDVRDVVTQLLDLGVDVNIQNKKMETPVFLAAFIEKWDVVRLLLEHGADPKGIYNAEIKIFFSPVIFEFPFAANTLLHYAAEKNNTEIVIQLLDLQLDINVKNNYRQTPAHIAANCKSWKVLKLLMERGADMKATDSYRNTLLHYVAAHNTTNFVNMLLELGLNVNFKNGFNETPALVAARLKCWDVLKLLLKFSIDPKACDFAGHTILHYAVRYDVRDIIIQLINKGLDVNANNVQGEVPILTAAIFHKWENVKLLIEHEADITNFAYTLLILSINDSIIDFINYLLGRGVHVDGKINKVTPALAAAAGKKWDIVKLLIEQGADSRASDPFGNTLLHFAVTHNTRDIITLLLDKEVDVNYKNKNLQTPILLAAMYNNWDIVKQLIQYTADIMACDKDGNTLLHYAAMNL